MSFLRKLEQSLDARLRGIFGGSREEPGSREAIELYRDALDQIAARAVVGKRGERVFPFNAVRVELGAAEGERRTVLEALFEPVQLLADVKEALAGERAAAPADLAVRVEYPAEALVELRVVCEKAAAVAVEALAEPEPALQFEPNPLVPVVLRTLTGVASEPKFVANKAHINIGREQDVVDAQGRAVRRNDLWFAEGADEANGTVSRTHAHVRFEAGPGEWRIYDDGSSLGTYIFRAGRRIDVPRHSPRGVLLLPGDEIYLGQVRLRLEIL